MSATSIDLSQIKTDALSAASTFRTLIGLGTLATQSPTGTANSTTYLRGDFTWQTISGGGTWGSITGTLSSQTDLQSALDAKASLSGATFTGSIGINAGTLNGTVLDIAQTWGGTGTYTGLKYNVTDSGPANAASLLLDLQVGGVSKASISKGGAIQIQSVNYQDANILYFGRHTAGIPKMFGFDSYQGFRVAGGAWIAWSNSTYDSSQTLDLYLYRDAAGILAQRNGGNAQTFRIYNTITNDSNYERAKIAWESNVLTFGTEALGTGSNRAINIIPANQTDGVGFLGTGRTRLAILSVDGNDPVITNNGTGAVHLSILRKFTSSNALRFDGGVQELLVHNQGYASPNECISIAFGSALLKSTYYSQDFIIQGHTRNVDEVRRSIKLVGGPQHTSATTYLSGGNVEVIGGAGASASAGAANGGHVYLDGGQGYGTGVHGSIIIGATRARLLAFGGTTSSFPAIKRNSAALNFRLADDSGDCDITAKAATFSSNITVSAVNIVTDTTTGTKIGTATTQKLGFFNSTPVVQPAAVADATDAASVITQLNLLLARMRDLGLIAT